MAEGTQLIQELCRKINWEYISVIVMTLLGLIGKFFFDPDSGKARWGRVFFGFSVAIASATICYFYVSVFWSFMIGFFSGLFYDRIIKFAYLDLWPMIVAETKYAIKSRMRRNARKENESGKSRR